MVALVQKRRAQRAKQGIGMPGDNSHILAVARRLRDAVDVPVLGGIAVYLHGGGRATADLDYYAADRKAVFAQLEAAGARWDKESREHVFDGVSIHTVSREEAGVAVERTSTIDGIRLVTLKDLVAIKLISGLRNQGRSKDLGDIEHLIREVPLDKRFAAKLPAAIRGEFKALVEAVRAGERNMPPGRRF